MTIQLSPALQKRVARTAKARGITAKQLVEEALRAYLKPPPKARPQESEARKRLRELNKYKKKEADFDAALHRARAYARQLEEDNAEFIELVANRYARPKPGNQ